MKHRSIYRPVRITEEEQRLLEQIAHERNASVSSVIRWAINTAARQEVTRLTRSQSKSGAEVVEATGAAL